MPDTVMSVRRQCRRGQQLGWCLVVIAALVGAVAATEQRHPKCDPVNGPYFKVEQSKGQVEYMTWNQLRDLPKWPRNLAGSMRTQLKPLCGCRNNDYLTRTAVNVQECKQALGRSCDSWCDGLKKYGDGYLPCTLDLCCGFDPCSTSAVDPKTNKSTPNPLTTKFCQKKQCNWTPPAPEPLTPVKEKHKTPEPPTPSPPVRDDDHNPGKPDACTAPLGPMGTEALQATCYGVSDLCRYLPEARRFEFKYGGYCMYAECGREANYKMMLYRLSELKDEDGCDGPAAPVGNPEEFCAKFNHEREEHVKCVQAASSLYEHGSNHAKLWESMSCRALKITLGQPVVPAVHPCKDIELIKRQEPAAADGGAVVDAPPAEAAADGGAVVDAPPAEAAADGGAVVDAPPAEAAADGGAVVDAPPAEPAAAGEDGGEPGTGDGEKLTPVDEASETNTKDGDDAPPAVDGTGAEAGAEAGTGAKGGADAPANARADGSDDLVADTADGESGASGNPAAASGNPAAASGGPAEDSGGPAEDSGDATQIDLKGNLLHQ